MFRKLRQKDIKRIMWILVIIIVPAFVFWGAAGFFKEDKAKSYIILGQKVSREEFGSFLRNLQIFYYFNTGNQTLQSITHQQWESIAWQHLLLAKKAEKEKIKVTREEILEKIRQFPLAQASQGFSKERYLRTFNKLRTTPGQFERFLEKEIKVEKLKERLFSDINITEEEIKQAYKRDNQQGKIKYIFIGYKERKEEIQTTEDDLKSFYENNTQTFKEPPKVKIAYILIKEQDSEKITAIHNQLEENKTLKQIAQNLDLPLIESEFFSLNSPIKGLGWQKNVNTKTFSMEKGNITGPLQTSEGSIFMKKLDQKESFIPKYAEIKKEVKDIFITEKAKEKAKEFSQEVTKKIEQENIEDLETTKKYFSQLEVKETDFFKRQDFIENIGLNPLFTNKVFSLKEKQILREPIELQKGFYIVQLQELKPIDQEKFEEKKEEYRQRILLQKRNQILFTYIQDLLKEGKTSIN